MLWFLLTFPTPFPNLWSKRTEYFMLFHFCNLILKVCYSWNILHHSLLKWSLISGPNLHAVPFAMASLSLLTVRDLFLHYSTYHSLSYVFGHCHTSQVAISIIRTEIVSNFCISHNTYVSPVNQVCMHVSLNVLQSHKKNLYLD